MLKLIGKGNLFFATAIIPFKNQDQYERLNLVLDTGAVFTIIDTGITDYLGYSAKDGHQRSTLDGAAGRSEGYLIKVPKFQCMGFDLQNFEVACHDMNSRLGVSGILGMNFLKQFRLDIDFNTGQIHNIQRVIP